MAGGLGSRFWPVSSVDCPKQFVDTMGVGRSMLQLTFERMEKLSEDGRQRVRNASLS